MSNKRLKFLWLDFPAPPDRWEPRRGEMGAVGYDKLTPREKRIADNWSICDQRDTFMEDAYLHLARSVIFITKLWVWLAALFILTFGPQLIVTLQKIYGVDDPVVSVQGK
jgi:hypothetical protein